MKTTWYFQKKVLRKRPYLRQNWRKWCKKALEEPLMVEEQTDGRFRHLIYVEELDSHLRVVFKEDHETVHNAFVAKI
jgi:hypothetical protein